MVVLKGPHIAPESLDTETRWLHSILNSIESTQNLAFFCEALNLPRQKTETNYNNVLKILLKANPNPFVFIFNKN